MADTVLAHIAALESQKENLATEALAFILNRLNRSSADRGDLRRILALGSNVPKITRVLTQQQAGEESRPDIEFQGEGGRTLGYIEVKFWAGLTEAQPVDYVKRLAGNGRGSLIFLAPEIRLPLLRAEIMERLRGAKFVTKNVSERSMTVGSVRLWFLSWPTLLSSLRDAAANNDEVASDVRQLNGLVAAAASEGFIPLSRPVLDDLDVPRRAVALTDLASSIVDQAVENGILRIKGFRATHQKYGTGRYAAFKWAGCWLGLEHEIWSRRGRSPVWMMFNNTYWGRADRLREILRVWLSSDPPRAYFCEKEDRIEIPIVLLVAAERSRVVADAVRQICELDIVLRRAKLPPLKGPAPNGR